MMRLVIYMKTNGNLSEIKLNTILTFFKVVDSEEFTATDIFRKTTLAINSIFNILNGLEKQGLIKRKKVGRKNVVKLTEKGNKLKKHLDVISEMLKIDIKSLKE